VATLATRNIDAVVKERLSVGTAAHGHRMEAEARRIPQRAMTKDADRSSRPGFYDRVHALIRVYWHSR
jgi:plasmid stability protein